MRLWKRASGVLKDQNSLWISSLSTKSTLRNPDIEAAVIKATSHDEFCIDYKNFHRVLSWLRLSDVHVKPTVRSISARMQKTRSWVVAVKGLMLMHGVMSSRIAVVQMIGRLPFDLSNFKDGYTKLGKSWAYNAFIRAYYAFLDSKSVLLYTNLKEKSTRPPFMATSIHQERTPIMKDIIILQKVQGLLDLLLQIKPLSSAADVFLIVEAMDGIVMESFDIYSRMCKMIAKIVSRVQTVSKSEAAMILRIIQKAVVQGNELSLYFQLCREIGVERATEIPSPPQIPKEDIELLKQIVNGGQDQVPRFDQIVPRPVNQEKKAIVVIDQQQTPREDLRSGFKTIITNNWEKFDEDLMLVAVQPSSEQPAAAPNPFLNTNPSSAPAPQHDQSRGHAKNYQELPDLISFL